MKSFQIIAVVSTIVFEACSVEPKKASVTYPEVPQKDIYAVVNGAIKLSGIKRQDLDLHAADITDYCDIEDYTIDSTARKVNSRSKRNIIFSDSDATFIRAQIKNNRSFVWDNLKLQFEQHEQFNSLYDISVPVFSLDLSYALVAVEHRQEPLGWSTLFLLKRKGSGWSLVNNRHNPYQARLGKLAKRRCRCACPGPLGGPSEVDVSK